MTVTDSSAISIALASLDQAISKMNTHAASASTTSTSSTTLINHYNPATPFEIYYRAGSTTYAYACALLSKLWDGQVKNLPSFISNLHIRADKVKWNAVTPHGILSAPTGGNTNHNIITKYQPIYSANTADAFATRTNNRAIQNYKTFYAMLYKSVTGNICDAVFEQVQKLPNNEDSVALFKLFMPFIVVVYLQLLIFSFNQIQTNNNYQV